MIAAIHDAYHEPRGQKFTGWVLVSENPNKVIVVVKSADASEIQLSAETQRTVFDVKEFSVESQAIVKNIQLLSRDEPIDIQSTVIVYQYMSKHDRVEFEPLGILQSDGELPIEDLLKITISRNESNGLDICLLKSEVSKVRSQV